MITYDEVGNVTGDTSQPDQTPKGGLVGTPSLDEMKHALSMFGSKTADMAKQMLQTPEAARKVIGNMAIGLGSAGQAVGEGLFSPAYGTPQIGPQIESRTKALMKQRALQPSNQTEANINEAVGKVAENLPIMPGEMGVMGRGFTPNDLRVVGAKAAQTGREIKSIPTDFANAQSGVKTLNVLGDETIGTKLQGVTEPAVNAGKAIENATIGEMQRAKLRRIAKNIGDIPDTEYDPLRQRMEESGNLMYAVRPKGSRIQRPDALETSAKARGLDSLHKTLVEAVPDPAFLKPETISADRLLADYEGRFLSDLPRPVANQLESHLDLKNNEEFPTAPSKSELDRAVTMKYNLGDALPVRKLKHIDDFFKNTPEGQQAASEHGIPTVGEYKSRLPAAAAALNTNFANFITKNIGAFGSKSVELASKGITYREPDEVINQAGQLTNSTLRRIGEFRHKAGFPIEGTFAPHLVNKEAEFKAHNDNTLAAQSAKAAFISEMAQQGVPVGEYVRTPEYARLRSLEQDATNKRDKTQTELKNLMLAHAQELLEDSAIVPSSKQEQINRKGYAASQLYPDLRNPNVPLDQTLYETDDLNDITNLSKIGEKLWGDIVEGRMTANQANATSIDNYIEKMHKQRAADKVALQVRRQKELDALTAKLKPLLNEVPPHLKFDKSSALEINQFMPKDEIIKRMSEDTDILEHCMGEAGSGSKTNINPLTGEKRMYEPTYDTLTGEINPRGHGKPSRGYASETAKGNQFQTSFRDNETGYPVASLQFGKQSDGKYSIGFVSGYRNEAPNAKYANDVKDYLNSKSDILSQDLDDRIQTNLGIYDTFNKRKREALRRDLGLTHEEMLAHDLSALPRFVTKADAQSHIGQSASHPAREVDDLAAEKARLQDELDQHWENRRNWDEGDETHHDNLVDSIRDLEQRIERQSNQPVTAHMAGMTPSMRELDSNGLNFPISALANDNMVDQSVRRAYEDILNDMHPGVSADDMIHHLSIMHSILQDPDSGIAERLGLTNDQVSTLVGMIDSHASTIRQLEQHLAQQRNHPPATADTSHTNNISQTIDEASSNFRNANPRYADTATFNAALQRAFESANPVTSPEDYIVALLNESRNLDAHPAGNALQNLAIQISNYHNTFPNARNERSPAYDANRILGRQQQPQQQQPQQHNVNALAEDLLNLDRLHTGEINETSANSTLLALDNGQMDLPEYSHIPPGPERARAMAPLRNAYQAALNQALEEFNLEVDELERQNNNPPPRPIHELYADLVGAIEDAIQEGSFDTDAIDTHELAEAIRNGEFGGALSEATPRELRLLADYVERNGFDPYHEPEEQQVANADPIARHIQTASLTQLQASLGTYELNEVRDLADEVAHPNNANTPRDLRQIAQMVRHYSEGQPWEDFGHTQRELLARQLEEHATDIEIQQRPPGHKKGGYITRKPSIEQMRFALMKGK